VLRFADFGVRIYSLNLIVNEMSWMEPARQAMARKIAEAVQEGYQLVRDRPGDAAAIFGKLFPDLAPRYIEVSLQIVARQLAVPIGKPDAAWLGRHAESAVVARPARPRRQRRGSGDLRLMAPSRS